MTEPNSQFPFEPPPKLVGRGIFGWIVFIGLTITLFVFLRNHQH